MQKQLAVCVFLFLILVVGDAKAAQLWPGEKMQFGAGYPAITKFFAGDKEKQLVVLIPGAHHMARIFYGNEQVRKTDFLAHWLLEFDYNVLAISYPVDTPGKAFDATYPDFTTQAWGQQAAQITHKIVKEKGLRQDVIVCGWSMGGKSAQPFNHHAAELGLETGAFIGLAATPPTLGNITMTKEIPMAASGLANRKSAIAKWYKQIEANGADNQGRTILSWQSYKNEYTGPIAIGQQAYGLRYKAGEKSFIRDFWTDIQDTKGYDYAHFPYVAVIRPNSPADSRHSLTDTGEWGLYITQKVYRESVKNANLNKLSESAWRQLVKLSNSAPQRLSREVAGNHFFFVGEYGAKHTAEAIDQLVQEISSFKSELFDIWAMSPK